MLMVEEVAAVEQECLRYGFTQEEQAVGLITNSAHPDAREGLWKQAKKLGLVKKRKHRAG